MSAPLMETDPWAAPTTEQPVVQTEPRSEGDPLGPSSLIAQDVSAWFGSRQVLERCSLRMEARQVTALIGPSGCGKSTFLRILNRMHETIRGAKVAGSVDLDDVDIYGEQLGVTEVRVRIGMVFQKPNPFPAMSIRDNVLVRTEALRQAGRREGLAGRGVSSECRALERGQGSPRRRWDVVVRGSTAALVHRPLARRASEGAADGRAVLGARPDLDTSGRRNRAATVRAGHDRHRHPQHAAGPTRVRPVRLLSRRGPE